MRKLIILLLFGILVIGGCNSSENNGDLSNSFTIKIYGDFTSSAASRYYESILTFKDDQIVSGWIKYEFFREERITTECNLDVSVLMWFNKSGDCTNLMMPPLTKLELQRKIDLGEYIKPGPNGCRHSSYCYEILN